MIELLSKILHLIYVLDSSIDHRHIVAIPLWNTKDLFMVLQVRMLLSHVFNGLER